MKMKDIKGKIQVLTDIARQFNKEKIIWAVGASAMLFFRKIVGEFNDLDLMVKEEDVLKVKNILLKMGTLKESESGNYATEYFYEFIIDGIDVDVMAGFKIVKDDIIYNCSLKKEDITESVVINRVCIPLDSLENWLYYYKLMGRHQKVEMIEKHQQSLNKEIDN
jgi:hypothetical protein